MDYKKIIKSRSARLKILRKLSFIPDKPMLKTQYWIKTGHRLNLKNPKRFTEKLQWYKLYYRNPLMVQCVDKYDVREYVRSKGLEDILIPCYGVFNSVEEIDWDALPEQFVMKDTLGGGGTSVIIVKDKSKADLRELEAQAKKWIAKDATRKGAGREWTYYSGKRHRIIIEKYVEPYDEDIGLVDYKFFCFHGKCEFLYVMGDRIVGESVKLSIFDRDFQKLLVHRVGYDEYIKARRPEIYSDMLRVAEVLSEDFPHVRVDLYCENDTVYFGELTFFDGSGYMKFEPDEFDFEIGNKLQLKKYDGA